MTTSTESQRQRLLNALAVAQQAGNLNLIKSLQSALKRLESSS